MTTGADDDGRQTRPADDVGRPDGSAERAFVDGWREAYARWIQTQDDWTTLTYPEIAESSFAAGWEARERLGRGEASHGPSAPDAETVISREPLDRPL